MADKFRYLRALTYKCDRCRTIFSYWIVDDSEWEQGGYGEQAICKQCFERRVPDPRYLSIEEYVERHPAFAEGLEETDRELADLIPQTPEAQKPGRNHPGFTKAFLKEEAERREKF